MCKLTPCCRNENIFALTLLQSIFSGLFLVRVFFSKEKTELDFYEEEFKMCFSVFHAEGGVP